MCLYQTSMDRETFSKAGMSLQNRIDPWGNLNRTSARGAWLGNRGILHNEKKEIVAPWRHKAWIICNLEFKGRKREVFSANSYSELFFLDEATALSAGHRPCAECRRKRYTEFKTAWCNANAYGNMVPVSQIDKQLHSERAIRSGGKVTFEIEFSMLPEGAFIETGKTALLFWKEKLKRWSFEGYESFDYQPAPTEPVKVLTPFSTIQLLRSGFRPQVHETAMR